jgi:hypothetical protein
VYRAVKNGIYSIENNKLYVPDGTWMDVRESFAPRILIRGVTAKTRFPDVLKLPRKRLELLQLGWRASDKGKWGQSSRHGHYTTLASICMGGGKIW